jgi:ferredoxin-NADP reductase
MSNSLSLELISQRPLNDNTVHFKFKIQNQQKLDLVAGQFLRLLFEQDGEEVFRSYSIANVLKDNTDTIDNIELAVSWVTDGLATNNLSSMKVGDTIHASAPYGRFCLTEKAWQRYFLIATGTGVTPYRAMTNELMQRINNENTEVFVVMGARDESGLLYVDEFRKNAETQGYDYITCLSRSTLQNPSNLDVQGHVQAYLQTIDFNPENDIAYICGNPEMVDEAFALLKEKGLPVAQIRREKYVSPPIRKKKPAFALKN